MNVVQVPGGQDQDGEEDSRSGSCPPPELRDGANSSKKSSMSSMWRRGGEVEGEEEEDREAEEERRWRRRRGEVECEEEMLEEVAKMVEGEKKGASSGTHNHRFKIVHRSSKIVRGVSLARPDVDNDSLMAKYCADNDNDLIQGRRRTEGLRPGNI